MKKFFNIPLLIIVFAGVLATNADAQTKVIANVPFAFSAGKTTLPAGRYTITVLNPASDRKVLQIRSLNGRASAIVMTTAGSINASDNAKLVFERYGDRYFFAQAQMGGDSTSLTAVRTKSAEKNAMAKTNKKSVVVIVGG